MRFTIDSSHLVISLSTPKSHVTLMPGQKPSVIMTSSEIGLFLGAVTANSPTWRASKEERGGGGSEGREVYQIQVCASSQIHTHRQPRGM